MYMAQSLQQLQLNINTKDIIRQFLFNFYKMYNNIIIMFMHKILFY